MSTDITPDNIMDLMIQKVREVAHRATTDRERFEALRYFAMDITDWLRHRSPEEQTQILGYLEARETPVDLQDQAEQVCFAQLVALIIEPPPIL